MTREYCSVWFLETHSPISTHFIHFFLFNVTIITLKSILLTLIFQFVMATLLLLIQLTVLSSFPGLPSSFVVFQPNLFSNYRAFLIKSPITVLWAIFCSRACGLTPTCRRPSGWSLLKVTPRLASPNSKLLTQPTRTQLWCTPSPDVSTPTA